MKSNTGNYHAELGCIECDRTFELNSIRYRCDGCGGLLEVRHDMEALRARGAEYWKDLFEQRYRSATLPLASGVWGKKEWVLPDLDENDIVSLGEGATPLLPLRGLASELGLESLYIKQCGVSHTGSFKDLGMTTLVSHVKSLRRQGFPIRAVSCASTGDTSAALAAYAAAAGIPTIVFLPSGKITLSQLMQPLSNGALVISMDTDFDGCMRVVREITASDSSIYLANSMNPLRIEGQKTISVEIAQQLGWEMPDWIIIPGGNLGNVSALAAGMRLMEEVGIQKKRTRLCLAQSRNANPMVRSFESGYANYAPVQAQKTQASAIQIGDPVSYSRAVRALKEYDGIALDADELELSEAVARTDRHGMFNCPHTGVALAAMFKLVASGEIRKGERVVVISTAHGLKFPDFKSGYHEGSLHEVDPANCRYRNTVVEAAADAEHVRAIIDESLASPTLRQ